MRGFYALYTHHQHQRLYETAITLPNPLRTRNAGGAEDRISSRLFAGGMVERLGCCTRLEREELKKEGTEIGRRDGGSDSGTF